jgi:hypothetical protein
MSISQMCTIVNFLMMLHENLIYEGCSESSRKSASICFKMYKAYIKFIMKNDVPLSCLLSYYFKIVQCFGTNTWCNVSKIILSSDVKSRFGGHFVSIGS